ncbi:18165_t:CDS:2, partial [Dentiscutata erythropus]
MSENFDEFATILPSHYKLDGDKLEISLVDGMSATAENFKELAEILPSYYKLDLTNGKLAIMPVHAQTGQREAKLIYEVTGWCLSNPGLVGLYGSSQTGFYLPLPTETIRCPDAYPPIAPNFVAEIRSTAEAIHEKMCVYMDAGVEEAFSIDPINGTARIYSDSITWSEYTNPPKLQSRVLNGF